MWWPPVRSSPASALLDQRSSILSLLLPLLSSHYSLPWRLSCSLRCSPPLCSCSAWACCQLLHLCYSEGHLLSAVSTPRCSALQKNCASSNGLVPLSSALVCTLPCRLLWGLFEQLGAVWVQWRLVVGVELPISTFSHVAPLCRAPACPAPSPLLHQS